MLMPGLDCSSVTNWGMCQQVWGLLRWKGCPNLLWAFGDDPKLLKHSHLERTFRSILENGLAVLLWIPPAFTVGTLFAFRGCP